MSIPGAVLRRVMREIGELQNNPQRDDMLNLTGIIEGPEGTPYAGGYFKVKFKFTEEFPAAPPKCWFATKMFHPNVGPTGEICVNTLKKDWKSTYGIGHILVTVKCLLIYPNPESALDEEAGKLLLEDYASYCSRAKLITSVHATPRVKPVAAPTPILALPTPPPISASISSTSIKSPLAVPAISRKSASPAPPSSLKSPIPDKSSLGVGPQKEKERHPSPSPLGTADANVGNGKPHDGRGHGHGVDAGIGGITGTKAVKRSATGSAATGAEKRKKALKRL
ncbi:ubiquitin-conjugating enzyme/RWD-like protein [Gymnopilus junonius]|uniref:Ubiquitin-conjugating enzyme/RWD-like protein n=1 Tax=Gymnopilus junonius TaxID=109634 RepID=A0A9P5TN10_GYMJU|nr:ubiquitin-conjugating enzyme/RWD-like protein [Gymnopilus junonius]